MLKIFISSHGHFASGIKSSVEILAGQKPNITVFDAYINQESVQEHLDRFFESVSEDDQVLLLSDLYGGSVNSVMYTYLTKPNTTLVAGVNLALVLELSVRESISPAELEMAREAGAIPVSLGKRILRAETAGLVAMAAIFYETGDLG